MKGSRRAAIWAVVVFMENGDGRSVIGHWRDSSGRDWGSVVSRNFCGSRASLSGSASGSGMELLLWSCYEDDELHYGNLASQIRIPCRVHEGLSVADDAELFLALNNQKAVSALDKYRVGVTKGIGPAFEVEQVISSLGLKVGANGGNVNAVAAVLSIHKTRGAEVLKRALAIAKESFSDPKDTSKFAGDLLHGIVMVICRKNSPVDDKDLIHSLRKTSATKLVHDARLLPTKNSARNMADTLVGQYNYQRSGAKRLPRFAD